MLKKKVWIPLIVLIGITGGFLFWQHHTAEQEPIKVYPTDIDTGDTSQKRQEPKAPSTPVETASQGHYHEDGTFHAEPHDTHSQTDTADSLMTRPPLDSPILTPEEIVELDTLLKTEGLSKETYDKLSEKQVSYLRKVGIPWDYASPEQQRQMDIDFYAQYGLKPPPEGWRYDFKEIGVPYLDENGNPIISRKDDDTITKSYGGFLLNASK